MEHNIYYLSYTYLAGWIIAILLDVQKEVSKGDWERGEVFKSKFPIIIAGFILFPAMLIFRKGISTINIYDIAIGDYMYGAYFVIGLANQYIITLLFWAIKKLSEKAKKKVNNIDNDKTT